MSMIDLHCDTLWKVMDLEKQGDLMYNRGSISIPFLKKADSMAQCFACFVYLKQLEGKDISEKYDAGYIHVMEMLSFLKEQTKIYSNDIALAVKKEQIIENYRNTKISALASVEEGGVINGKIERVRELSDKGVRMITLLWNFENCIGYPNSKEAGIMKSGLKEFGRTVIEEMNRYEILADISHASDKTALDILEYSSGPVVASHSNCRAVKAHPRNMSDEIIRKLAEKGGVAGLNFYGPFLGNEKESRIDEMVSHIKHMIQVGGSELPAMGTDFDGYDGIEKEEIPDISKMELLWNALEQEKIAGEQLDKIMYKNALRVL